MMKVVMEERRDWDFIREPEKVEYLLKNKIPDTTLFMKGVSPTAEFNRGEATSEGFGFYCSPDLDLSVGDKVTLYTTLKRQLEIDFEVTKVVEPGTLIMSPREARIGKSNRSSPRIPNKNELVSAANFLISKNEIIIDNTRPQISNKVIFNEFERRLSGEFPGLKIYDYADRDRPQATKYLNRSEKAVLVEDCAKPDSYTSRGEDFEDYKDLLTDDNKFEATQRQYVEDHINSVMAMPLLYETPMKKVPIAFMYCEARGEHRFGLESHARWREMAAEIIQRIADSNTLTVKDRQKVVNISEGGVALEIDNPELMKYLPNQSIITFDLVFKLQAPMRFQGKVVHISQNSNSLIAGVDLEGSAHSTSKTDSRDRLKSLINMAVNQSE